MATGNVFISYRREDAGPYAGRLCDHLNRSLGAGRVFMDVEDIAPGERFAQAILEKMAESDTALIVIGPRWAQLLHERLDKQQPDYVRVEIEAALARPMRVVPVLVGGATMAQLAALPGKLADLAQYEAAELRDSTFAGDCDRLAASVGLPSPRGGDSRRRLAIRVAAAIAFLAVLLFASGWLGIGPVAEYRARRARIGEMLATARTQTARAEPEAAFRTCQELLKIAPGDQAVLDLQLDAAMQWLRDFHIAVPEGGKADELAAARLDESAPVLDAGLARTAGKGPRAATILAHVGWWHWLNRHLAQREFGPATERGLRDALRIDPRNVYANAMLGNWLLQNGGSVEEALAHFKTAVESNQERPLVRQMQMGVLTYPRDAETRTALLRAADEMRRNQEPLDARSRRRILSTYSPTVNSADELRQTLAAVPPSDAWATYLWLNEPKSRGSSDEGQQVQGEFIRASLLEIEGKRSEALEAFSALQGELRRLGYNGRIATYTESAIERLSTR